MCVCGVCVCALVWAGRLLLRPTLGLKLYVCVRACVLMFVCVYVCTRAGLLLLRPTRWLKMCVCVCLCVYLYVCARVCKRKRRHDDCEREIEIKVGRGGGGGVLCSNIGWVVCVCAREGRGSVCAYDLCRYLPSVD